MSYVDIEFILALINRVRSIKNVSGCHVFIIFIFFKQNLCGLDISGQYVQTIAVSRSIISFLNRINFYTNWIT